MTDPQLVNERGPPRQGGEQDVAAAISLAMRSRNNIDEIEDDNSDHGSSSMSSAKTGDKDDTQGFDEGKKASTAISFSRCLFFFTLIAAAAGLAVTVYLILSDEESDDFESQFQNLAGEFTHLSNHKVNMVFGTLQGLAVSAASLAKHQLKNGSAYPAGFVTLPDAEIQMHAVRNVTGALAVAYMPNVESADHDLWIQYSNEHKSWISEANNVSVAPELSPYIWEYEDATERAEKDNPQHRRSTRSLESCSARRRRSRLLGSDEKIKVASDQEKGPFSPVWTMSPAPPMNDTTIISYNLRDRPVFEKAIGITSYTRNPVFLDVCDQSAWFGIATNKDILQTVVAFPVFNGFGPDALVIGMYTAIVPWLVFFQDNLVFGKLVMVMTNTCDEIFTFEIDGQHATFLGEEDLHDPRYDHLAFVAPFADFYNPQDLEMTGDSDPCVYTMMVYPTQTLEAQYNTMNPLYYSLVVVAIFGFTALAFLIFDCLVTKRQANILSTAKKQNAIVASLFPAKIHEKLMEELDTGGQNGDNTKKFHTSNDNRNRNILEDASYLDFTVDKPIADLFPATTIMFADIVGFTAWSSTREPYHVFALLETIYGCFDVLAKRRRVFKVEVVGDCYVAVCGLPDPCKDHHLRMCRFANDCLQTMQAKTRELEVALGPDTAELGLRVGLHSGPVVAGVLRGDKTRFQLFGDTMNMASRMESTSIPNRIQVSAQTAELLSSSGKNLWLTPRGEKVLVKGKGELDTYFLTVKKGAESTTAESITEMSSGSADTDCYYMNPIDQAQKRNRVSDWMAEMLANMLREVLKQRQALSVKADNVRIIEAFEVADKKDELKIVDSFKTSVVNIQEQCIPHVDITSLGKKSQLIPPRKVRNSELEPQVIAELHDYVRVIASLYKANHFHCFDHASHVTMSCVKLLSRIVVHDDEKSTGGTIVDALDRFAVVFAALIHDVDHSGVPNTQLVKEGAMVATTYDGKSVAEQNSFSIAWKLLMQPAYVTLRRQIYTTSSEFLRFRSLVANYVLATDIVDKDLKQSRNDRWEVAFNGSNSSGPSKADYKSMIFMEHLIQASDVAHTMQHWAIYRKWNERFFAECHKAYRMGRAERDPAETWYEGEKAFFDFYIIPLARKLKECGVFGVSSDEYLSYALQNRQEWEQRGQQVVAEMVHKIKSKSRKEKHQQSS